MQLSRLLDHGPQLLPSDLDTAEHLGIALNAPTAEACCVVTNKDGVVIYVGEFTYPGDYVKLNIELIP